MKFIKTILKNLKILFRLRASLIAVILGPLIVIFLIGFAFSTSSNIQINIGYHLGDESALSHNFINALQNKSYNLKEFSTQKDCENQIKQGLIHTCIFFPKDFVIQEGKSNNITFVVDKSRINIVYTVIDSVSKEIGFESDQLSKGLTDKLLQTLTATSEDVDYNIGSIIKIKRDTQVAQTSTGDIKTKLEHLNLTEEKVNVDFSNDITTLNKYNNNIYDKSKAVVQNGMTLVNSIRTTANETANLTTDANNLEALLITLNTTAHTANNKSAILSQEALLNIESAIEGVTKLTNKLKTAKSTTDTTKQDIVTLQATLSAVINSIDVVKQNLERTAHQINSIQIKSSEQIINPINTNIQTVTSDKNQLVIMFPYVLLLVIMFIGMLLASTLVVIEKKSKAAFRVFTTPTKDEYFTITTFVTSFIIIAAQVAIILILMKYFFIDIFASNILVNLVLITLSTTFFIMLGMAIGHFFSNQQGTNMASIFLGAIFLFISNIMLPLESVAPYLQKVAQYNPYVLASEMLRKSILFQSSFQDLQTEIFILLAYSVVILILLIIGQKLSRIVFIKNITTRKKKKTFQKKSELIIQNKKIVTEKEFVKAIYVLTEAEFKKEIIGQKKKVKEFIKTTLKKPQFKKKLKHLEKDVLLDLFAQDNLRIIREIQNTTKNSKNKNKKEK